MHELAPSHIIPSMTPDQVGAVQRMEDFMLQCPQIDMPTVHSLHAGVYTRTIKIPAEGVITGALIQIPTTLIVAGKCTVIIGDKSFLIDGYHVFAASANRKQAFMAHEDTYITMIFKTAAENIEQAEEEFTEEAERLMSRQCDNFIVEEV